MNAERFNLIIKEFYSKTRLTLKNLTLRSFNLIAKRAMLRLRAFS